MARATRMASTNGPHQKLIVSQEADEFVSSSSPLGDRSMSTVSTPATSITSQTADAQTKFGHLEHYIALGCLHLDQQLRTEQELATQADWVELLQADLPDEVKLVIGDEALKLLDARWIRLFFNSAGASKPRSLVRVYLLPEDWGRRFIDRNSRILKAAVRHLLQKIDTSPDAWAGNLREAKTCRFDPWATAENVSLYYLFNKLPSPAPNPEKIKSRYTRVAVRELLQSAGHSEWEEHGEQPLPGLKTRLYAYQARSASLMIQREAAPALQLDPRLEVRTSPNGEKFFFSARDGSFLQEPRYYEANRGGILAETMGLGKTLICLAIILATRGHYPQIPAAYLPPPRARSHVGSLSDMAASIIGRHSIPAKALIEQAELNDDTNYYHLKEALQRNIPFYEIPYELPRMNRKTEVPPPRQLVLCSGSIIVVPRNLLHQWQSEIQKHVIPGALKVLVVDSVKRGGKMKQRSGDNAMEFASDLPAPTELMKFDVILFTRNRFEQEIQDGADESGRRAATGVARVCDCTYIGATRIPDCNCVGSGTVYESPLKKLHWLRVIIDEGHSFSSSASNAVLVAKQIQAERRWVISGTPAKNLVGVEVDMSTLDLDNSGTSSLRETTIEERKAFSRDNEGLKATKALGLLASHFLMVRPWCDSGTDGKLEWDDYVYRHEHQHRKTHSAYSTSFLRALEGLVVKTRPEDVEKDIILPSMKHRVVYLQPCWFDKMTANLFIQVLRTNAVTSERQDVDYLFHKNSIKARHSLIRNLRQSNFTWTGFTLNDVISTIETSNQYLSRDDKKCSPQDISSLVESSQTISRLSTSNEWIELSKAHEVGMAVESWPTESEQSFALAYPSKPALIGITTLIEGQLHVDSNLLSTNPAMGLEVAGQVAKAKVTAMIEVEEKKDSMPSTVDDSPLAKTGVPPSCVGNQQPVTSRRVSTMTSKTSPQETDKAEPMNGPLESAKLASPARLKKRKLTLAEEQAELPASSELRKTLITGTTSAKLTYLLDKVMQHQATEKIIIFYDGDNAAFYIAQCLEMLYINYRIYARTLDNTKRSEYVLVFNQDPDVRVLLIDVACGALGLNLNAASIVLIVNPINRPGIEAQAIKRAHRIGQTKPVIVETLVLENTIEHAIFNRAKKMSRAQHSEVRELEDDAGIVEIIQNACILPILPGEEQGEGMFAKLKEPQRVFGRPNRHKYHRYGMADPKTPEKSKKKAKTANGIKGSSGINRSVKTDDVTMLDSPTPVNGLPTRLTMGIPAGEGLNGQSAGYCGNTNSIFGSGDSEK